MVIYNNLGEKKNKEEWERMSLSFLTFYNNKNILYLFFSSDFIPILCTINLRYLYNVKLKNVLKYTKRRSVTKGNNPKKF